MSTSTCIYCGDSLIPDPQTPTWRHCPTCSPVWAKWAVRMTRLLTLEHTAAQALADTRGRPSVGGRKT